MRVGTIEQSMFFLELPINGFNIPGVRAVQSRHYTVAVAVEVAVAPP